MAVHVYRSLRAARGFGVLMMVATLLAAPAEARKYSGFGPKRPLVHKAAFPQPRQRASSSAARSDGAPGVSRYCAAALRGDRNAQFELGYIYAVGRGVRRDDALAAAWFRKAAAQGVPQARHWLTLLRVRSKAHAVCQEESSPHFGPVQSSAPNPAKGPIVKLVRSLAPQYHLDPNLVLAVVAAESNFDPSARSDKNAQGLMQLIPATAERFGVQDVWDPEQNLRGGMAYLRWLLHRFDGNVSLALAGYNAGEDAVERYKGIPPYQETRDYVDRIAGWLNR
jgi:soluble lytic murein transglycosylase-like protein